MDIVGAIKRPFTDVKGWLIGCALNIVPIVNFLSMGYVGEAAKMTLKKKSAMPAWENWGQLFFQGLLLFIIGLLYALPSIILALIAGLATLSAVLGGGLNNLASFGATIATLGVPMLLAFLLGIVAAYLGPVAAMSYLSKGKFGDAFDFGHIFKKAFSTEYLGAWVVSIIIWIIAGIIFGWIPVVGTPIGAFTAMAMAATLIAEAYRTA